MLTYIILSPITIQLIQLIVHNFLIDKFRQHCRRHFLFQNVQIIIIVITAHDQRGKKNLFQTIIAKIVEWQ